MVSSNATSEANLTPQHCHSTCNASLVEFTNLRQHHLHSHPGKTPDSCLSFLCPHLADLAILLTVAEASREPTPATLPSSRSPRIRGVTWQASPAQPPQSCQQAWKNVDLMSFACIAAVRIKAQLLSTLPFTSRHFHPGSQVLSHQDACTFLPNSPHPVLILTHMLEIAFFFLPPYLFFTDQSRFITPGKEVKQ